jgi:hypothetical protein
MPINDPLIAGIKTTARANAKTVAAKITSIPPPQDEYAVVDGVITAINQRPEREGQIIIYRNGTDLTGTMYVVIKDSVGFLLWKPVENWGVVIDPRTGLKKDPNLSFYSTLAT